MTKFVKTDFFAMKKYANYSTVRSAIINNKFGRFKTFVNQIFAEKV